MVQYSQVPRKNSNEYIPVQYALHGSTYSAFIQERVRGISEFLFLSFLFLSLVTRVPVRMWHETIEKINDENEKSYFHFAFLVRVNAAKNVKTRVENFDRHVVLDRDPI